jgi:hypothetical protein
MENIKSKGTKEVYYFPDINFDAERGVCELGGESFIEDSVGFYAPYMQWLKDYLDTNNSLEFNFSLTYFNTSSSKRILDILRLLREYELKGKAITVNWILTATDHDMEDEIEDFTIISKIDINVIDRRKR